VTVLQHIFYLTAASALFASGSIPARKSLAESPEMAPPANYQLFYGALSSARGVEAGTHYPELSAAFGKAVGQMYAGELTVDAAAAQMQADFTKILSGG